MGKIKWPEKVINEEVLKLIGEKKTIINTRNNLRRNANWIGDILRRNCLLHDATVGQTTQMKGVGRIRTQLFKNLKN